MEGQEQVTHPEGRWLKNVRFALRKAPENLTDRQRVVLAGVQQLNASLYRAYLAKETATRALPPRRPDRARASGRLAALGATLAAAALRPLACTVRRHRHGILAAITLGLSNARLEGLHTNVRLLSHPALAFTPPLRSSP